MAAPEPEQQRVLDGVAPFLPDAPIRTHRFIGPLFSGLVLQPIWDSGDLHVLADAMTFVDGARWLHVSFSRKNRLPDYKDIALVRRAFFRPGSVVLQVFPPVDEHVNVHPNCLHLWERLDGPRLVPDLRVCGPMLGSVLGLAI